MTYEKSNREDMRAIVLTWLETEDGIIYLESVSHEFYNDGYNDGWDAGYDSGLKDGKGSTGV